MARIAGVNVPDNKRAVIALTYIHGIGRTTAHKILEAVGVDLSSRMNQLSEDELNQVRKEIESDQYMIEGDLRREVSMNIKRLMERARIAVTIGITVGKNYCGLVGSRQRQEYTIMGDFVNLAARLMKVR